MAFEGMTWHSHSRPTWLSSRQQHYDAMQRQYLHSEDTCAASLLILKQAARIESQTVDMLRLLGAYSYAILQSRVMLHSLDLDKGTHRRQLLEQFVWLLFYKTPGFGFNSKWHFNQNSWQRPLPDVFADADAILE